MHSILINGEQHNTTTAMMVRVGCILWSYWLCFRKGKNYYLCFYKDNFFLVHGVFFYLLNLIFFLQANKLYGLQSHWFLSLHDFLQFLLYTNLVDYKSLVLERPVLGVQFPPQVLVIMIVSDYFHAFKGFYIFGNFITCPKQLSNFDNNNTNFAIITPTSFH